MSIVVDIEIIEHVNSSTFIGTDIVIGQIDDDTHKTICSTIVDSAEIFHYWNSYDFLNAKSSSKLRNRIVDNSTSGVFHKQTIGKNVLSGIQGWFAGTLVVLAGFNGCTDKSLSLLVSCGISSNSYRSFDGVQIIILPNRTNVLLVDLIIRRTQTTVPNQSSSGNFLIKHHTHFGFEPSNNIKISDINYIITVQLLLFIDSGRSSSTLQQSEYFILLQIALDVTFSPGIILCNIGQNRFNTGEGSVMDGVHNLLNPSHISLNELRGICNILCIREQIVNLLDTVCENTILKASITFSVGEDSFHVGMTKNIILIIFVVKYIVFHSFISSFRIIIIVVIFGLFFFFKSLSDHCINYRFLFFSKSVEDVGNGFLVFFFIGLLFVHGFVLLFFIGMI